MKEHEQRLCRCSCAALGPILMLLALGPPVDAGEEYPLSPVPVRKSTFYRKHVSLRGLPILASAKVGDYALKEAAFLIDGILKGRDDILQAMARNGVNLAIMAPDEFTTDVPEHSKMTPKLFWDRRARGLGPIPERPVMSCGEENLLCYKGDPYWQENILVHEFAHAIHHMALSTVDPTFDSRLQAIFEKATGEGLWKGKYAGRNRAEYWAEGVQSWFDDNRENDHDHNHVNRRKELDEYDPDLAALIASVFRNPEWRYRKPSARGWAGHLAGHDPAKAPQFAWPKQLRRWWEHDPSGRLEAAPIKDLADARSSGGGEEVPIFFLNRSKGQRKLYWIDFTGQRQARGTLRPHDHLNNQTFAGHPWLVTDENDQPLGLYHPHPQHALVILE